jgi:hypothetical protein
MAQKPKIPEAGNSGELKRLQGEIEKQKRMIEIMNDDITEKKKEISALQVERGALATSLEGAYARIKKLEASVDQQNHGEDKVTEGYVSIASCPLPNGTKPLRATVEGIIVPRTIDEDGICHEDVPVETAIALLSEGSGFKRYLTGPVNSITGKVKKGLYMQPVTFFRHTKKRYDTGKYEFVRVLVEDPSKKA